jgi:hypothetical protein
VRRARCRRRTVFCFAVTLATRKVWTTPFGCWTTISWPTGTTVAGTVCTLIFVGLTSPCAPWMAVTPAVVPIATAGLSPALTACNPTTPVMMVPAAPAPAVTICDAACAPASVALELSITSAWKNVPDWRLQRHVRGVGLHGHDLLTVLGDRGRSAAGEQD